MKKLFQGYCIFFCFIIVVFGQCYGMWGIWRDDLPAPYAAIHHQLAQLEKDATEDDRRRNPDSEANLAFAKLKLYDQTGVNFTVVPFLEAGAPLAFSSGDVFAVDPDPQNPQPLNRRLPTIWCPEKIETALINARVAKERYIKRQFPKYENAYAENPDTLLQGIGQLHERLQECECGAKEIKSINSSLSLIKDSRDAWEGHLAHLQGVCNTGQEAHHLYDSEQSIMSYMDYRLKLLPRDAAFQAYLDANGGVAGMKHLVLHMHTYRDMCPFCLYSMHLKIPIWSAMPELQEIPLAVMVSSRLKYGKNFTFLRGVQDAQGALIYAGYDNDSMRSINLDGMSGQALTPAEIAGFIQQGQVIQVAAKPAWVH